MLRRISFLFVLILLSARVSAEPRHCHGALAKVGSSSKPLRLAQHSDMGELLNLMNDRDPEVRSEAIVTGAKVLTQPSRFSLSPYHRWELIKALKEAIKKTPEVLKARSAELAILKDQAKTHAATAKPTVFSGSQAQITDADISRERRFAEEALKRLENEIKLEGPDNEDTRVSRDRTRAEAARHLTFADNMEGSKNLSEAWDQLNAVLIKNQN